VRGPPQFESMRINWFSNAPWAFTGYGNQTKVFVPRLQKLGHEMSITAFYGHEGAPIVIDNIPIFGKAMHPFGQDVMALHARTFRADILISLLDIWVVRAEYLKDSHWVAWFPIDHEPVTKMTTDISAKAWKRLVFSRFAVNMLREAGQDCDYIPHGVDTNIFKPLDMSASRKEVGMPEDAFIVGMVAANKGNPPRKGFFENIEAFAQLVKKHKDAILYLHTHDGATGAPETVNLLEYCKFVGLEPGKNVFFADQYLYALGYPDEAMAKTYSALDTHLLVSKGEGFGIPQLEAQACGVPVICGDWTAMSEIFFAGWIVGKDEATKTYSQFGSYQYVPRVGAITARLEAAYLRKGTQHLRNQARAGALNYDTDLITQDFWKPYLERLQDEIKAEAGKFAPIPAMQEAQA